MMKLEVVKVEPLELPADILWKISGTQKIALKDFALYIDEHNNKIYINKSVVKKKDVTRIVNVATSEDPYILDDSTENGDFMSYVYNTYGYETYNAIFDYHKAKINERRTQCAKERIKEIIPMIEEIMTSDFPAIPYNEHLIYEVKEKGMERKRRTSMDIVGYDYIYTFYLGCLMGMGKVKKDDYAVSSGDNILDYYYEICDMLEHIDVQEMPRIYCYLKEMYFTEQATGGTRND